MRRGVPSTKSELLEDQDAKPFWVIQLSSRRCIKRSRTIDVADSKLIGRRLSGILGLLPGCGFNVAIAWRHFRGK